jgi:hypothetical protein
MHLPNKKIMNKKITKVVFPVAGTGTSFLPATKACSKEVLFPRYATSFAHFSRTRLSATLHLRDRSPQCRPCPQKQQP